MASKAKDFVISALVIVVGLYFAIAAFVFAPYYNWQYARDNGFTSWLLLGELTATAKSFAWPYLMLSDSATSSTVLPGQWSSEELANSTHFSVSIQADLKAKELSRKAGSEISDSQWREVLMLKETVLREIRLVRPSVLHKIHPDLPRHVADEYIPALENIIRNLSLPGGDSEAELKGVALFDKWADWWNANREVIYIPK